MRIHRNARDKYQFNESYFDKYGSIIFSNLIEARQFTQKINEKRNSTKFPTLTVKASDMNGIAVITEIFHYLFTIYQDNYAPNLYKELIEAVKINSGPETFDKGLKSIINNYPPSNIYNKTKTINSFLEDEENRIENISKSLENMSILWLMNLNPAFLPYKELFDDSILEEKKPYDRIILEMKNFFEDYPKFGPKNQNFLEMLQSLSIIEPRSIKAQLQYLLNNWSDLIGILKNKVILALDFFREEEKETGIGPGKPIVIEYDDLKKSYTTDRDWMPNVVMIAKNIYVWLSQLSEKYGRKIRTLDQIPDEELVQLNKWGFNALWLIGIWERSPASKLVKQWCGNPEAEASAYSLFDYVIANDLGGETSFLKLKQKALIYNIRLASDMVPNHTGIDSNWVREHPDWYISLPYSPFPSYTYSGVSLGQDPNIGIYLEDHYFNRTDAAVTFKRVDFRTGDARYIYHGNDGTSMSWNDTAQLNYLLPEVREAVIQIILDVAQRFSIIRFDAAMTLTKLHYQRLWFPSPGSGGAIPSRAEYGISKVEFDKLMPTEFWREVVNRINQEAPDTLLLAEAFWLLEGYFVRTLGMHRVYNSAFMNMLRDEENANYRSVIKNTLEYDPEILKRFVNFMNNPDEETAINQFGKGEKYFGICILLSTLPGLPMFGHGQLEGFAEKYGMEYRKAYWKEEVDEGFLEYHKKIIFPLLKMRYLFSEVRNFLLYDFFTDMGFVNEDVFAYSNKLGSEKALVIYHNKFMSTQGWIKTSVAILSYSKNGERLIQKTLGEGLELPRNDNLYCVFRDFITGLEYIRNCKEIYDKGLYIELEAYKSAVFLDFRIVESNDSQPYDLLHKNLDGRGVLSVSDKLEEIKERN